MFNQNRTFGVEIEFFGVSRQIVAAALIAKGINAEVQGYNHVDSESVWKLTTDSSVNPRGCGNNRPVGNEIVSPILKGQAGLSALNLVLGTLKECGAKVDATCGIHVHHDAHDFKAVTFKNLYGTYIKYESTLDELFPQDRRGNNNTYCKSFEAATYTYGGKAALIKRISEAKTIDEIGNIFSDRYIKLNFRAYRAHGTIEFRQHGGSLSFKKIAAWVIISQAMVERAIAMGNRTIQLKREDECTSWNNFKIMVRITPSYGADEQQLAAMDQLTKIRKERAKAERAA